MWHDWEPAEHVRVIDLSPSEDRGVPKQQRGSGSGDSVQHVGRGHVDHRLLPQVPCGRYRTAAAGLPPGAATVVVPLDQEGTP